MVIITNLEDLLPRRVGVIGIGCSKINSISPELSYKELAFDAAVKAYRDGGIDPKDVDTFICCSEDLTEGTSIFDEYVPDQIGAVLKPVHTISADAVFGVISAAMQIHTGLFDIAVVEAHSKASNIVNLHEVLTMAVDPVLNRPLDFDPHAILGLEMARFLYESGNTSEYCAAVASKNRRNALKNPLASSGADISIDDVLNSDAVALPLKKLDLSQTADGAVVIVLASEDIAKARNPVWIDGMGWCSDAIALESRSFGEAYYARKSAEMAYRMAGITNPQKEICFAEIDDTASYKELQHMEAMGLSGKGRSGELTMSGYTLKNGKFPVNVSGGALGIGDMFEAKGGIKILSAVKQMRETAGEMQIDCVKTALVQVWRGIPTATGAVLILNK